jgi:hypothetical protein
MTRPVGKWLVCLLQDTGLPVQTRLKTVDFYT